MRCRWIILLTLLSGFVLSMVVIAGSCGWKLATMCHRLASTPSEGLRAFPFGSGDLLLFSSGPRSWARAIETPFHMLMADCPVTHVAMAVRDPRNGLLRCWELAMGGGTPDILRLSDLRARVQSYRGLVLVRKLVDRAGSGGLSDAAAHGTAWDILARRAPRRYRSSFYLNTYDSRTSNFMFAHPPLPIVPDDAAREGKEWICTDLICEMYRRLGVFGSADFSLWPRDFCSETENLPLDRANWRLSKEILLEKDCGMGVE